MPVRHSHVNMMLWFFLSLFLISALMLGWLLMPFMSILILASVVTSSFNPCYMSLARFLKPPVASLTTCIIIFMVLFVPIVLFVGILSTEAYNLYLMARGAALGEQIKNLLDNSLILERTNLVLANFNVTITGDTLRMAVSELGKTVGLFLFQQANAVASNVLQFLVNFFFMLLVIYFLLIDGKNLVTFIMELSPLPDEQDIKLFRKFKDMAGAILIGNGVCGLVQGVAGGLVFAAFGLESAFLWGAIMALLAFLPIIGIGAVFLPASLYLFLVGRTAAGIFFVIFYMLLSGGVEYIFKPRLVGNRVRMHPLLVFLTIMGGLKLFGILGIVYGPLGATAFLTLTDIYHASYQIMLEPADD